MNFLKKIAVGFAFIATFSSAAMASVTQTASNNNYYDFYYGGNNSIMTIDLAKGTNNVSALTTSVNTADQGWGGQCDCNQAFVGLVDANNNILWGEHVAGSQHSWSTYTFDLTSDLTQMGNLNALLASYNYGANGLLSLQMFANNIGWSGWEFKVNGASMSVTSSVAAVPEPGSIALLGLGMIGFGVARRKVARI